MEFKDLLRQEVEFNKQGDRRHVHYGPDYLRQHAPSTFDVVRADLEYATGRVLDESRDRVHLG